MNTYIHIGARRAALRVRRAGLHAGEDVVRGRVELRRQLPGRLPAARGLGQRGPRRPLGEVAGAGVVGLGGGRAAEALRPNRQAGQGCRAPREAGHLPHCPRRGLREMGGAPRSLAPRNRLLGVDCQTIRLPLQRWAL